MFLLHIHGESEGVGGGFGAFAREVMLDGLLDTLKIIPFLFLTYLIMELIEHRASEKTLSLMKRSGSLGPLVGGLLGAAPQCAFSAVAANLYTGRVITVGTLVAVFLSTSDEMLPILIAADAEVGSLFLILAYKVSVAVVMGFAIDLTLRLLKHKKEDIDIDRICESDNCHCERGVLYSALHHTVTITLFIFIVTLLINSLIFFIGTDRLSALGGAVPGLSHLIFAFIGLIPGCATSVAITTLGIHGVISTGAMLSGLFPSAGVGIIILARLNHSKKETAAILLVTVLIGFIFGLLADLIGITV